MSGGTSTLTSFTRGENPLRADKLNTALSERVSRAGDVMDGYLELVGDPIAPFDAATKQYVDSHAVTGGGSGGNLSVATLNVSNAPNSKPDGSPPDGLKQGDVYKNGTFLCIVL